LAHSYEKKPVPARGALTAGASQAGLIVGGLTILLGIAISAIRGEVGALATYVAAGVIVIVSVLNAVLVSYVVRSYHMPDLYDIANRLTDVITAAEYNWVISDEQLAAWETTRNWDKITVVSPDLSIDTGSGPFVEAVKANIRRGVHYQYVLPAIPLIHGRIPALEKMFARRPNKLTISKVDPAVFHILPGHIVIYQLTDAPGDIPMVVMESPYGVRHWLLFNEKNASAVIGSIARITKHEHRVNSTGRKPKTALPAHNTK